MKVYDGTGMVADKSGATILPIRIEGAQYTHFSRLRNIVRLRFFPKITLQILPPTKISVPDDLRGKARRHVSGLILTDIMSDMMFATSHYGQSLFSGLLEAKKIHGGKHTVAEDLDRIPLSYNTLITRSIAIGNALTKITAEGENVGIYLPNSSKTLNVVLGLQIHQRVPAMLNYSIGASGMLSACHTAEIKTVLTSHRFIELGKFAEDAQTLSENLNLIYLEDLAKDISTVNKLTALIQAKTAHLWYPRTHCKPDSQLLYYLRQGPKVPPKV